MLAISPTAACRTSAFPSFSTTATEDVEGLRTVPEGSTQRLHRRLPHIRILVALGIATEDVEGLRPDP